MKFDEYNKNIKELVKLILESRVVDPVTAKKGCKKIIKLGKENSDSKLLGFGYYYLAEAYFFENEYAKLMKNLIIGIKHQQQIPMEGLLARSYNLLGINSDNQGNIPAAIDYYLTSLKYSSEKGLYYEEGLANTNIGQVYAMLQDYKPAINYLTKAHNCLKKEKTNPNYLMNLIIIEATLGTCYLRLGNLEEAKRYYDKIDKNRDKFINDPYSKMIIYVFEATYFHAVGENVNRNRLIDDSIALIDEVPSLLNIYDEVFALCDLLKETGRYDELWKVLERIEKLTKQAGITNMLLRILKTKMQYYQFMNYEEAYLCVCAEYVKLSEQLDIENKTSTKKAIELRLDLERVKERQSIMQAENTRLLEKSERDPLTKLPNRDKLNSYSEAVFEKAFRDKTSLAVEIFDIDYFKQYNDTYGHQAGDKCIKKIAQLLHSLKEDGIFCARYGGDEFIIIYENMMDEEILRIAQKLQQDVMDLKIEHINSTAASIVTISQGIRNSIPREGNKLWDYFYVADMAMYQVKRTTKNNVRLVHKAVAHSETEIQVM